MPPASELGAPAAGLPTPEASTDRSTTGPQTQPANRWSKPLPEDHPILRRGFMVGVQRSSSSSPTAGRPSASPTAPPKSGEPSPPPTGGPSSSLTPEEQSEEDRLDRAHWQHRYGASNRGPTEWNDEAVIACRFSFRCPKLWSRLQATADASIRTCATCVQQVHLVRSEKEFDQHARQGHCVAVQVTGMGERDGLMFVGQPRAG